MVRGRKISDNIADELERMIIEGVLQPGQRLPAERDLAKQFEVSRPTLREALQKLEAHGVVEHRHGSGTFVSDAFAPAVTEPLLKMLQRHPETIHDLIDFRQALEGIACYHAAIRANEADREILTKRFNAITAAHESNNAEGEADADADFHLAIAEAAHNIFLLHVMRSVFELLKGGITSSRERMYEEDNVKEDLFKQHESIYRGIMDRDPDRAWQAEQDHLKYVAEKLRRLEREDERRNRSMARLRNISA